MVLSRESGTIGGFTSLPGWPCQNAGEGDNGFMAGQVSGGQVAGPCGMDHTPLGCDFVGRWCGMGGECTGEKIL